LLWNEGAAIDGVSAALFLTVTLREMDGTISIIAHKEYADDRHVGPVSY
jgi:hypothetical protein